MKAEALYVSKLEFANIISTKAKKLRVTNWNVPGQTAGGKFAMGMRVCRELQSLFASSFLFGPKEFTYTFLRKGFEEPVHPIKADRVPTHDQPFALRGRLCVNQGGHEEIKVGWVDVADGDDAEVWCGGGLQGEACAGAGHRGEGGAGSPLREEDGDLVFVDSEEKQGGGLTVEVREVCPFEGGVGW